MDTFCTVYTAFTADEGVRMCLHPVADLDLDTEDVSANAEQYGEATWPVRVVYDEWADGELDREWTYSCGGSDVRFGEKRGLYCAGSWVGGGTAADALRWLLEGEDG